jgi:flagella basal body P-ring formation protein FlgA
MRKIFVKIILICYVLLLNSEKAGSRPVPAGLFLGFQNKQIHRISEDEIIKLLRDYVKNELMEGIDVQIEIRDIPDDILVYKNKYELRVVPKPQLKLKGNRTFHMELYEDGRLKRKFIVQARVRTFDYVLIANRRIKQGEIISEGMFSVRKVETTFLRDDYVGKLSEILGKRLRKSIMAGEILFANYVEDIPLVKRGNKVRIQVISPVVKVETEGIAKQDGWLGDEIRVLNLSSKRVITAKVAGKDIVRIEIK